MICHKKKGLFGRWMHTSNTFPSTCAGSKTVRSEPFRNHTLFGPRDNNSYTLLEKTPKCLLCIIFLITIDQMKLLLVTVNVHSKCVLITTD